MPIPVDIGEVDPHGKCARIPQGRPRYRPKPALAIVEPNAIRREQIVANINIRSSVLIHIAEHHRQPQVPRLGRERLSLLVHENPIGPGYRRKTSSPIIEI